MNSHSAARTRGCVLRIDPAMEPLPSWAGARQWSESVYRAADHRMAFGEVDWSRRRASNPRHSPWKGGALPAELHLQCPGLLRPTGPRGISCVAEPRRRSSGRFASGLPDGASLRAVAPLPGAAPCPARPRGVLPAPCRPRFGGLRIPERVAVWQRDAARAEPCGCCTLSVRSRCAARGSNPRPAD